MIKVIKKLSLIIFFTLMLGASSVLASGKMEVGIGQEIQLIAQSNLISPIYKWVVKKGNEIINVQSSKIFNFAFPFQGEYIVNLTATNGDKIESTKVSVLAGDRYPRPYSPEINTSKLDEVSTGLKINLKTLPTLNSQGQVFLLGDGRLQFLLEGSKGDILEYRIDRNIFEDSDGNGVANDDIDNSGDDSYLTGGAWLTTYQKNESPKIAAQVTLVSRSGKKKTQQIEVLFNNLDQSGDLTAVLKTLPEVDSKDNLVYLYNDPHLVSFYARESKGKIIEYRIDRNIFEDSNGDGDPKNDIDNLNDISFKNGDVFEVSYPKSDEQIIAQLITVGEGGKGSRVQIGLGFGKAPVNSDLPEGKSGAIRLISDKLLVIKGDPVNFKINGLSLDLDEYTFSWDFDGDDKFDKEIEAQNEVQHIYEIPGSYLAQVRITDKQGNTTKRAVDILVRDIIATKADFSYEVIQNKVKFKNLSTANGSLSDSTLDYEWVFGDTDSEGYEVQRNQIKLENPTYEYKNKGKYLVTLVVTDAEGVVDSKTTEIEVKNGASTKGTLVNKKIFEKSDSVKSSTLVTILKFTLYLVLIVIALIFLIFTGLLILIKIQHPDLVFEELIDELKVKILTMIGVHEADELKTSKTYDIPKPPVIDEKLHHESEESPLAESDKKSIEVSEGEVVQNKTDRFEGESTLNEEAGPMPDWMNVQSNNSKSEATESVSDEIVSDSSTQTESPSDDENIPSWMRDKEVIDGEIDESDQNLGDESPSDTIADTDNETQIDEVSDSTLNEDNKDSVDEMLSEDGEYINDAALEDDYTDEDDLVDSELETPLEDDIDVQNDSIDLDSIKDESEDETPYGNPANVNESELLVENPDKSEGSEEKVGGLRDGDVKSPNKSKKGSDSNVPDWLK